MWKCENHPDECSCEECKEVNQAIDAYCGGGNSTLSNVLFWGFGLLCALLLILMVYDRCLGN
jgi:hypothetical protein